MLGVWWSEIIFEAQHFFLTSDNNSADGKNKLDMDLINGANKGKISSTILSINCKINPQIFTKTEAI